MNAIYIQYHNANREHKLRIRQIAAQKRTSSLGFLANQGKSSLELHHELKL